MLQTAINPDYAEGADGGMHSRSYPRDWRKLRLKNLRFGKPDSVTTRGVIQLDGHGAELLAVTMLGSLPPPFERSGVVGRLALTRGGFRI